MSEDLPENGPAENSKREFVIRFKRPTPGRAIAVVIALGIIALVVGLVASDLLRGAVPAHPHSATPKPSASATALPTPEPTAIPTRAPVLPPTTSPGSFTMPALIGDNAIAAANTLLALAPSVHLQFVDQNGHTVEARPNQIVVATLPSSGVEISIISSVVLSIKN